MKKNNIRIIACMVLTICVISGICLSSVESVREFALTKRVEVIDADTVTILHSSDGRVCSEEITSGETIS